MKILFLWTHLSGYLVANLNAAVDSGHEIHLLHFGDHEETPFGDSLNLSKLSSFKSLGMSSREIRKIINDIEPDLIVVCGWHIRQYRFALFLNRALVVLYMDNQWKGTIKQKLALMISRFFIKTHFDFAFLPGARQREYALKLGFPTDRIWLRALNADTRLFEGKRSSGEIDAFLYVGRLSPEKGIVELLNAYEEYRLSTPLPWKLDVIGDGPLSNELIGKVGVTWHGFLNQYELVEYYEAPSVFIMPSLREAWGVAMHEAALTGHPIIATKTCGASDELVRENLNGYLFIPGDHKGLVSTLIRISQLKPEVLSGFGHMSYKLAKDFNSRTWIETLNQINESAIAADLREKRSKSFLRLIADLILNWNVKKW